MIWADRLHFANIMQTVPGVLPPPFPIPSPPQAPVENQSTLDLIAGDIRVIRDATECQHLQEAAAYDAKKDQSMQLMMLRKTSRMDGRKYRR